MAASKVQDETALEWGSGSSYSRYPNVSASGGVEGYPFASTMRYVAAPTTIGMGHGPAK